LEFNPDKVRTIVSEINGALERLEELKGLPKETFLSDPHKIGSAKYSLLIAIEGTIDLANHLIAKNGFRTPEDYSDTFKVLAERGAFDEPFSKTLSQMARFRNRLVHIYWEINNEELHRLLQTRLDDIRLFLKKFGALIDKR
jgi:uncharacterized protein YutE (UPF0331/DUF86 family)